MEYNTCPTSALYSALVGQVLYVNNNHSRHEEYKNINGAIHYVICFLFLVSSVQGPNIFLRAYFKIIIRTTEV
jgi:hypothetical protein